MTASNEALPQTSRKIHWGGMLFGLAFFCVGAAFLLFGVLPNLWDAFRMRDWIQVPAQVVAVDLETTHSDDATTWKVTARFSYDFNGKHYTGNRVGISGGGADNVGNWQQNTYNRLRNQRQTDLWINPEWPSESVFDRELRWGLLGFKLIFVVTFGGVGAAVMWLVSRRPRPVPSGLPNWRTRAEWYDNAIRSNARSTLWFAWGFAVFWNAISSFIPFVLPAELEKGNQLALVALIFPAIGLGLLIWAIRKTLDWRRFGPTLVKMDPFPGALGGDVGGALDLRLAYNPQAQFRVTLTCNHVYTRRRHNSNETVRDVQWQDEQFAAIQPGMRGTRLHFRFQPPDTLPESSVGDNRDYEWVLDITASLPGADFNRSWEVPVFRDAGPQSTRAIVRPSPLGADSLNGSDPAIRIRQTGAGLELYFPYFRQPGMALGTLVTGGCFAGFAWFFHLAKGDDAVAGLFIILFAAVGALIFILGLYLAGNSLRITAGTQGLRVVRGLFGLHFARHVTVDQITAIEKSIGMQSRQGNSSRAYYRIEVHTRDGRRITAGSGVPGASRVDALIQRMHKALGLPG